MTWLSLTPPVDRGDARFRAIWRNSPVGPKDVEFGTLLPFPRGPGGGHSVPRVRACPLLATRSLGPSRTYQPLGTGTAPNIDQTSLRRFGPVRPYRRRVP